jgi:DNA-binding NtrC family response regulator
MAKIALIGIEKSAADQLANALDRDFHHIESKPETTKPSDFTGFDMVFAGGDGKKYLSLLQDLRRSRPAMPFVVVTRLPDTSEWLDALEAGATDYCSAPFEPRQMKWLVQSALFSHTRAAVAA